MSGLNNAQAGPSGQAAQIITPKKKKSARNEKARAHHKSHASRVKLEAAAIEDLDRRAMEFVSDQPRISMVKRKINNFPCIGSS